MKKFSAKISTLLLTFAVGTITAGIGLCQTSSMYKAKANLPNSTSATETKNNQKALEMVFVVDTTGSMGGLIEGAKQKIWSIVNDVMTRKDHPSVKIGLVAYRDNGDAYVTQVTPLTDD